MHGLRLILSGVRGMRARVEAEHQSVDPCSLGAAKLTPHCATTCTLAVAHYSTLPHSLCPSTRHSSTYQYDLPSLQGWLQLRVSKLQLEGGGSGHKQVERYAARALNSRLGQAHLASLGCFCSDNCSCGEACTCCKKAGACDKCK